LISGLLDEATIIPVEVLPEQGGKDLKEACLEGSFALAKREVWRRQT
jgi:hypothetical protein